MTLQPTRATIRCWIALAALALPAAAAAQAVPNGCYSRTYSAEHLAANPEQVVEWITLAFYPEDNLSGQVQTRLRVRLADQGHAARDGVGGMVMMQFLSNFVQPDAFHVDGDGGSLRITQLDAAGLIFETGGLFISPGGDFFEKDRSNLSEGPGRLTTYRLDAAPLNACG